MAEKKGPDPTGKGGHNGNPGRKSLLERHVPQLEHVLQVVALGCPLAAACRSARLSKAKVGKLLSEGRNPKAPPAKADYARRFDEAQQAWLRKALQTIDRNTTRGDSKSVFRLLATKHPEFRDERIQKQIRDLRYRVNDLATKLLGKLEGAEGVEDAKG